MRRAEVVALDSPDLETKVGAVLINKETGSVVSEGYNGFIRGANDKLLPKTRPDKYVYMIHAESNILCNAGQNAVSTRNAILVITLSPCVGCTRLMFQAGIKEIYFKHKYRDFQDSFEMGDLNVECTEVGDYYKICLSPKITE